MDILQFCNYPCTDPFEQAREQNLPPPRSSSPPPPDTPILKLQKRVDHTGDNLQDPLYHIQNDAGSGALSDRTAYVSLPEV